MLARNVIRKSPRRDEAREAQRVSHADAVGDGIQGGQGRDREECRGGNFRRPAASNLQHAPLSFPGIERRGDAVRQRRDFHLDGGCVFDLPLGGPEDGLVHNL